jgi:putative Mg2+ transporter-C (MgtC) family protein
MIIQMLSANWRGTVHAPLLEIELALMAVLCGGVVGIERQRREKPAGMRTIVLVCLGSATFTMASYIFNTASNDSGRVVAQIVTGIGFLGAGVIMRGRGIVSGATTAATIWMTAAIGVVIGSGYALAGLGLGILVRLVLIGVFSIETRSLKKIPPLAVIVEFDPDAGKTRIRLGRIMVDFQMSQSTIEWLPAAEEGAPHRLHLELRLPRFHLFEMLDELVDDPCVKAVHGMPNQVKQPPHAQQVF